MDSFGTAAEPSEFDLDLLYLLEQTVEKLVTLQGRVKILEREIFNG